MNPLMIMTHSHAEVVNVFKIPGLEWVQPSVWIGQCVRVLSNNQKTVYQLGKGVIGGSVYRISNQQQSKLLKNYTSEDVFDNDLHVLDLFTQAEALSNTFPVKIIQVKQFSKDRPRAISKGSTDHTKENTRLRVEMDDVQGISILSLMKKANRKQFLALNSLMKKIYSDMTDELEKYFTSDLKIKRKITFKYEGVFTINYNEFLELWEEKDVISLLEVEFEEIGPGGYNSYEIVFHPDNFILKMDGTIAWIDPT
jgi:hypothetical protein